MSIKTLRNHLVPKTRAWVVGLTLSALVVTASTLLVIFQPTVVHANGSAGQGNMTGNVIIDPNAVLSFENLQSAVVLTATFSCVLPQGWVPFKLGINLTLQQTIGSTTITYQGSGDTGSNIPPPTTCNGASNAPVEVTVFEDLFNPDVQQFQAGKAVVTSLTFPYTECSTIANGTCYDQTMDQLVGFSPTTVTLSAPSNYVGSNYSGANLSGQNLSGKNMQNALFNGTNFQGANLSGVNAPNASFQNANLTGANLAGATLQGANFQGHYSSTSLKTWFSRPHSEAEPESRKTRAFRGLPGEFGR